MRKHLEEGMSKFSLGAYGSSLSSGWKYRPWGYADQYQILTALLIGSITLGRLTQYFKSLSPHPINVKIAISTHQDECEDKMRSPM